MNTSTKLTKDTVIQNVATVDLRTTPPETLERITRIENAALLLYSPETAAYIGKISIRNTAAVVEAPVNAKVLTGQEELRGDALKNLPEPISLIIVGQLTIASDLAAEDIQQGLGTLVVVGQIVCPQHLVGAIQSKTSHLTGQILVHDRTPKLITGKLTLTEAQLAALEDESDLLVMGKMTATQPLPNDLIARKIRKLQLFGMLVCAEENSALLQRLDPTFGSAHVVTIPTGFEHVERPLEFNAGLLASLSSKKLYAGSVRFGEDVEPAMVDKAIAGLQVSGRLIAPAKLQAMLAQKCNLLETSAVFYEGTLCRLDEDETLNAEMFDYLEGPITLVVEGDVTIAPEVEGKLLAGRLHQVYNFGDIHGTPAQLAALRARMVVNEGELINATQTTESEPAETVLGNTAYLKL